MTELTAEYWLHTVLSVYNATRDTEIKIVQDNIRRKEFFTLSGLRIALKDAAFPETFFLEFTPKFVPDQDSIKNLIQQIDNLRARVVKDAYQKLTPYQRVMQVWDQMRELMKQHPSAFTFVNYDRIDQTEAQCFVDVAKIR